MNIAEGAFVPTFPIDRLEAARVEELPGTAIRSENVHIAWRFEYAESKFAAYAVGVENDGRMTIMEVMRGQFTPTALARRVVNVAKAWSTHRVMIEDTPGAQSMVRHIRNEALELNWRIEILWQDFIKDETARNLEIKSAEPHLLAGRLLFDESIKNLQETFRQLYHFGMIEEVEIASVVSKVAAQLPSSIAADDFNADDEEAYQAFIAQDAYDRVYNRGRYAEVAEVPPADLEEEEEWAPPNADGYMPGLSG